MDGIVDTLAIGDVDEDGNPRTFDFPPDFSIDDLLGARNGAQGENLRVCVEASLATDGS